MRGPRWGRVGLIERSGDSEQDVFEVFLMPTD